MQEIELSHWGSFSVVLVWSPPLDAVTPPSLLPLGPCLGSYLLLPCLGLLPWSGWLVLLQHLFQLYCPSFPRIFSLACAWVPLLPWHSGSCLLHSSMSLVLWCLPCASFCMSSCSHIFSSLSSNSGVIFLFVCCPFFNMFLQRLRKLICLGQLWCMVGLFCLLWSQLELLCLAQDSP